MTLKYEPKYQEIKHPCPDFVESWVGKVVTSEGRTSGCNKQCDCKNHDKEKCVLTEKLVEAK